MAFKLAAITKICNLLALVASTDVTPGLYVYSTTDAGSVVMAGNYFNAATWLVEGSIIEVFSGSGKLDIYVVSNIAGVVVIKSVASTVRGQSATVTAVDTIATGLVGALGGVIASFNDDIALGEAWVTASIGDQVAAPVAGSFYLKTWEPTSNANPTPIAATTFGKKVSWTAWLL